MQRFFISDTHFGHKNIIDYENRPFRDCDHMQVELIKRWSEAVGKRDMVYFLGDLSFLSLEKTAHIVAMLNGRKLMVIGNHDAKSPEAYRQMGFEFVSKYPIIVDDFFICSHAPVYVNDNMPYVNIHGHLHSKKLDGQYFNVSVENIDYRPILFDDIKRKFSPI